MAARFFVDCHSHVVPSGDDGASGLAEGRALCAGAARHGTRLLFATPHVWPHLTLTTEREQRIRAAYAELAAAVELELRLGFELTPAPPLLEEDPRRYILQGTRCVLVEVPFHGPLDLLLKVAAHIEQAGLTPLIAHPERAQALLERPAGAARLADHGWLLQINATSLVGYHGTAEQRLAWRLLEDGLADVVASDGHRAERPPHLDAAFELARRRIGEDAAVRLFDGSALELSAVRLDAVGRPS